MAGYWAECLTETIFTEGNPWDELRKNVPEATSAFFFDRPRPEWVRLHLVRDQVLLVWHEVSEVHQAGSHIILKPPAYSPSRFRPGLLVTDQERNV
jgi:hypothetical protein